VEGGAAAGQSEVTGRDALLHPNLGCAYPPFTKAERAVTRRTLDSMSDLLDFCDQERLSVADAELLLWRRVEFGIDSDLLMQLIDETPWRLEHVTVRGRTYAQPRLIAWYGDDAASYSYSGIVLQALPWTPVLLAIKAKVDALCGCTFNSTLLNYYRDHRDSMGFHSDDEPELGPAPIIA
jgi:alkylated DNA repair dioxygenase AlkB